MSDKPYKFIFLQQYENMNDDRTWCAEQINNDDDKYILFSEYESLQARIALLEETIKAVSLSLGDANEFMLYDNMGGIRESIQEAFGYLIQSNR